jgi:glycosyltransferase involved in cell wall biosynthesis
VATAAGGLVDAVEDGVTGLVVPSRDSAALRAALERLLGDHTLRRSLGSEAARRARTHWSLGAAASAVAGVYAEVSRSGSERGS